MSIVEKINKLEQIKSDIKGAIVDKGVEITDTTPFTQYAVKIGEISGGGEPVDPEVGKYPKHANYSSGYTIVGSDVTVDENKIAKGFSNTSYIKINYVWDALPTDEMEINCSYVSTKANYSQGVMASVGTRKFCIAWIDSDEWYVGASNGSSDSWNILGLTTASGTLSANTKYKLRVTKGTSTGITCALNDDNSNTFKQTATLFLSSNAIPTNMELCLGTNRGIADDHFLIGTMDLKDAYILKNGEVIWEAIEGAHTYPKETPKASVKRYLNLVNTTYQSPMQVEEAVYHEGKRYLRGIIKRTTTSTGYNLKEISTEQTFNPSNKSWEIGLRYKFDNTTSTGSRNTHIVNSTEHYKNLALTRMKGTNTITLSVANGSGWLFDTEHVSMSLQPLTWYRIKYGYDLPNRTYYVKIYNDNNVLLDESAKWVDYDSVSYDYHPVLLGSWTPESDVEDTNQYIDLDNTYFSVDGVRQFEATIPTVKDKSGCEIVSPNFKINGTLTVDSTKYTDFGGYNYIHNTYHTNTGNIIYQVKFKTGTDGNEQYILASYPFSLFVIDGFKLGSWNSISGTQHPYQLQAETWYYVSMKCSELANGRIHHEVFVSTEKFSTDQIDFAYDYEEVKRTDSPDSCRIGAHTNNNFPFKGVIDMYETKVIDSYGNVVRSYYDSVGKVGWEDKRTKRFLEIGTGLVENNGVFSNFSNDNYISIPTSTLKMASYGKPASANIEFNIGFRTASSFDSDRVIVTNTRDGASLNDVFVNGEGKVSYWSGSSVWGATDSLLTNTNYLLKIIKKADNSTSYVYYIEDKGYTLESLPSLSDWTLAFQLASTSFFSAANSHVIIGKNFVNQYYPSLINMNKCNMLYNDTELWRAIDESIIIEEEVKTSEDDRELSFAPAWYVYNPNLHVSYDNVISGFSTSNYMQFSSINLDNKSWEINTKVKTPAVFDWSGSSGEPNCLHIISCRRGSEQYGESGRYGVHVYFQKQSDGTVMLCCDVANSGGSGWQMTASSGFKGGSIEVGTEYFIRMSFDGVNKYKLEYSTDGSSYVTAVEKTDSTKTYPYLLGNKLGVYGGASLDHPFTNGKIYLEDTYIKVDGRIVWRGVQVSEVAAKSSFVKLTQAEYDALEVKDEDMLYAIVEG